ncbi:Transducin/WD40 repeat-like superfamily protein [Raphanus sativus]|uniref:Protein JINGUBANG-like n=1 Tax=Raphanus sativus TaxID=3726 RepID=A0A6J0N934_RAPSA|nr:protein JINGUBANG-like [Raphanus sativus]KAJ4870791.1 Transducin/WD40 repeat-like superfamily protein [Raphanus sativus]
MRNETGGTMVVDLQADPYTTNHHPHDLRDNGRKPRSKFGDVLKTDHDGISSPEDPIISDTNLTHQRFSSVSSSIISIGPNSGEGSPCVMSPWARVSPAWASDFNDEDNALETNGLIGSIVREEGHIYSLAATGDLLYTGSDSKNVRVWKNLKDYAGFKSSSGLIKAIVICGYRVFTGHQDGKIRIWKISTRTPGKYRRVGTLPTFKSRVKTSVNPKYIMEGRRNKNSKKTKHKDAVSSLSMDVELGLLYSSSWDRTIKVWRISDSKCLECIQAHDDAINSVMFGFDDLVFTGSADGTVKVWRREMQVKGTRHELDQVLLKQENAVTALAVKPKSSIVYSGSSDGLVNYWERSKGIFVGGILKGHKSAVLCLTVAGNLLLSGAADKNICVWRRDPSDGSHNCVSVLTGHMGPVKCLAVEEEHAYRKGANTSADTEGDRKWIIYSGSLDKSVKVWRVSDRMGTWREVDEPSASSGRKSSLSPHEGSSAWGSCNLE